MNEQGFRPEAEPYLSPFYKELVPNYQVDLQDLPTTPEVKAEHLRIITDLLDTIALEVYLDARRTADTNLDEVAATEEFLHKLHDGEAWLKELEVTYPGISVELKAAFKGFQTDIQAAVQIIKAQVLESATRDQAA